MVCSSSSLAEAVSMSFIAIAHGAVHCVTMWTDSSVSPVSTASSILVVGKRDKASAMLFGPVTYFTLKVYAWSRRTHRSMRADGFDD